MNLQGDQHSISLDEDHVNEQSIFTPIGELISKNQEMQVDTFLQNNQSLNLKTFRDQNINTLLHLAAFVDNPRIIQKLIKHQLNLKEDLTLWVNSCNQEGFPPIFIACYKGNLDIVKQLMKNGASLSLKSSQGLYVLHAAAQGDSPVLLKWFIDNGVDLNQKDDRGSTALHWAVYAGAEQAVSYLLAWKIEMNEQDKELGYTALHLAALQGLTRIVRRLLVRGADRTILDSFGRTALTIAEVKDYPNMQRMLIDKIGFAQFCNLRQPFRPLSKNFKSVVLFLILFLISNGSLINFLTVTEQGIWVFITLSVIILLTSIIYIQLVCSDPGRIKIKIDILQELISNQPQKICPDCEIIKPARSKHCEICQSCFSVYDHHCPWINNCVGAKNYGFFFTFLFFLSLNMAFSYVILILHLVDGDQKKADWISYATLSLGLLVATVFIIPLLGLLVMHAQNLLQGTTTNERFSKGGKKTSSFLITNSNENSDTESLLLQQSLLEQKNSSIQNATDMCWRNGLRARDQNKSSLNRSRISQVQIQDDYQSV